MFLFTSALSLVTQEARNKKREQRGEKTETGKRKKKTNDKRRTSSTKTQRFLLVIHDLQSITA